MNRAVRHGGLFQRKTSLARLPAMLQDRVMTSVAALASARTARPAAGCAPVRGNNLNNNASLPQAGD
jgi:hypothetical protein